MKYKLRDVLNKYIRGPFGSALKRGEMKSEGIPVYEQQNAIYDHREFRFFIDDEKFNELKRFQVQTGDLIISCSGTLGKVSIISKDDAKGIISQALLILRPNSDIILPEYLYYFFKSDYGYRSLTSRSSGSVQINLAKREVIEDIDIFVPSKLIQEKIVKVLKNIDNKIKVNNEINNNLYELSQKIYSRWFTDFEYPISLNQTYKSNGGCFKEDGGLVVPEDFRVCNLDEICDCQNGHAFYKEGYDDSGLMVIDLGNVSLQGNFVYTNADKYIDRNRIPNEKFIVKKNDLVMIMTDRKATMDLLGKTAKVYEDKEYALNQRIYRIRPTINVNYVYGFLNSSSTREKLKGVALGSVQKYVNTNHINDLKIVVPSTEIMNEYSKVVDPIFKRMEENILENRNLEIMRDSLLPKLMNGEIDLDNIEI